MASVTGVKETDAKPGGFLSTDLFVYTCMSAQCVLTCFKINHLRHKGMKEVEQHFTFSIWHMFSGFGS